MSSTTRHPGQLALLDYQALPSVDNPCFSHLLVCSTAPLEAERPYRHDLTPTDLDGTAQRFQQLRTDLSEFFKRQNTSGGPQHVRLVVRIHGYNVPLKSVRKEYERAQQKFRDDAARLRESPPDDYVFFVHYAWPSERIGAGGPLCWISAMPMGLVLLFVVGSLFAFVGPVWLNVIGQCQHLRCI